MKKKARADLGSAQAASEERVAEYTSSFRAQIKRREEDIANLEAVHGAVKSQLERRVAELEAKSGERGVLYGDVEVYPGSMEDANVFLSCLD